jgi:hypothetical protein
MVTPNSTSKTVILSEFSAERAALLSIVSTRISASNINRVNFDIHDNYKLETNQIRDRLDAITNKFRKCEMIYHLYFDELDHEILAATSTNLPIMSQRTFQSSDGIVKQYFEVDSRTLYQELIDYNFQEIILFTSSVLENLVYLSETLIKKVSIHPKKNKPQSITMINFMEMLGYLHRLNYRNPADPVASCLQAHERFLNLYLPTINVFRNKYIHGFSKKLKSDGSEYVVIETEPQLVTGATDLIVSEFTKKIIEHLKVFIPEFLTAITATINASVEVPA